MNVKISHYSLDDHYNPPRIGLKVCSANGCSGVGTIISMSPEKHDDSWRNRDLPKTVTVLWGSGINKGKTQEKDPLNLADFSKYFSRIESDYNKFKQLKETDAIFGM